jgi:3-oxoacyl-[acyl-carrier protein] reductase
MSVVRERLAGKVAIVTGGGSGIGAATVRRFLDEGAKVVSVDLDRDAAAAVIGEDAERALARSADVTDKAAIDAVVAEALERFGGLDCYFNNAGAPATPAYVEEITLETWERVIAVNLTAAFLAAQAVIPIMKRNRKGVFLINASMSGARPRPMLSAYCASKGGAIALAKELALEVAEFGVRANAICPVATDTPMYREMSGDQLASPRSIPMGRLAKAEEMASVAAFLASDDASFMTGSEVYVDGGRGV